MEVTGFEDDFYDVPLTEGGFDDRRFPIAKQERVDGSTDDSFENGFVQVIKFIIIGFSVL